MLVRLHCQPVSILRAGGNPKDEGGVDRRQIPHGVWMVARGMQHAMCVGSRIAKGGQSVDEFGATELGFEFADAIDHLALEVCDDRRSSRVS